MTKTTGEGSGGRRDWSDEARALAGEVRAAIDGIDAGEDQDLDREEALRHYALGCRLREWIGGDGDRLDLFDEHVHREDGSDLTDWLLIDVPENLSRHRLLPELINHCRGYAEVFEPENLLGDLGYLLAEADACEEAVAQAEANLARFPEDVWVVVKAGDAFATCGLLERAEDLYRRALSMAGSRGYDREGVLERLIPLLEERGKIAEARMFIAVGRRLDEAWEAAEADEHPSWRGGGDDMPFRRSAPRIGRNDPCPCGSARKYKKCCGSGLPQGPALALVGSRDGRAPISPSLSEAKLLDLATAEVVSFIDQPQFAADAEQAVVAFWGAPFTGVPLKTAFRAMEPAWAHSTFVEWLMLDHTLRGGGTFLDEFLEARPPLDPRMRALLERWRPTHLGLYVIEEVRPNQGFVLRDLLEEDRVIEVAERAATSSLSRWDMMAARLMEMDGAIRITGGLLPMRPVMKERLLETARRAMAQTRESGGPEDWPAVMKRQAPLFHHLVQQELHAPPPRLVTPEGDEVILSRAYFRIRDREALFESLRDTPQLEEDPERDTFVWYEETAAKRRKKGSGDVSRILGTIEFRLGRLVLLCSSRERLDKGKRLIARRAGAAVAHVTDSFGDPWAGIEESGRRGRAKGETGSVEDGVPAELRNEMVRQFLDRHYRSWVDEPVPALEGRTPREASRSDDGRRKLVDLLRLFENGEAQRAATEPGYTAYDFSWLWEELGLGAERR